MKTLKNVLVCTLFLSGFATLSVQAQVTKQASVIIDGEVKNKMILTPADVDKLPKTTIIGKNRAGKKHIYTGVALGFVLKQAGVSFGDELRGENLTKYLLVEASDGYQVLFSLAEIDPAFTNRKIILANREDGAFFTMDEGPFRIIIDGEKRMPRNAKQVVSLKIKFAN